MARLYRQTNVNGMDHETRMETNCHQYTATADNHENRHKKRTKKKHIKKDT